MEHPDHVRLIEKGVAPGELWIDLGSGRGAFTLALADCLGGGGDLHALDIDRRALKVLDERLHGHFPQIDLHTHVADFTHPLPELPTFDGVLMANSLHFVRAKDEVLAHIRAVLKPGGKLLLVEYDTDHGNYAVPHPLSFKTWQQVAAENGFTETTLLATRPSRFLGSFFASLSIADAGKAADDA